MRKVLIVGILSCLSVSLMAQRGPQVPQPQSEPLVETPLEKAEIESDLKDLVIVQLQFQQKQAEMQALQKQFQESQTLVDTRIAKAKKDHGWGDDVAYNKQTATFEKHEAPAPHPAATKK